MRFKKEFAAYNFIGTEIAAVTYEDLFELVDFWFQDKDVRSHHVAVINAYCAVLATRDKRLAKIYSNADLVGPDGMPFVYWLKMTRRRPCDQFDATSIVLKLAEKASTRQYSFYLYGGHPDVLEQMKKKLERMFPHIRIVGCMSPPFRPLSPAEDKAICDEINTLKPDIIFVGLGTPKQDYWIEEHITKINGAVFIPCGAVFDFFGGRIKRAPTFISRIGLEWLYRLFSRDFKRLWYRYTVLHALFVWYFFLQLLGLKVIEPRSGTRED